MHPNGILEKFGTSELRHDFCEILMGYFSKLMEFGLNSLENLANSHGVFFESRGVFCEILWRFAQFVVTSQP